MTSVSRTFTVSTPPQRVVDYLADFSNATEWDPGTVECTRIGDGPVAVGAKWHNVSKIAGVSTDLEYTLEELTINRIVLVGRNKTATSREDITVESEGAGSKITYSNNTEMNGAAKLAAPIVKLVFEKLGNDTENQLSKALENLN